MEGCGTPDPSLGVAIRLAGYLDCQARALGENGFQAMAGGPLAGGLLSGVVTIFVALIGYRLLLGGIPDIRDGIGWAVRLGVVLALVTGWPAFQTLVYRVAVDGPVEVAGTLLPATGLPSDGFDARIQAAYDTIRLGTVDQSVPAAAAQVPPGQTGEPGTSTPAPTPPANPLLGQPARPQTATLFVVATTGFMAALRLAAGLLLALAPLALLGLLFDATLGLFSGWVRALAGTSLALVGITVVTALHLVAIESELAGLEAARVGTALSEATDAQGLTTIVMIFIVIVLVTITAALRMAGAFRLEFGRRFQVQVSDRGAVVPTTATPMVARQQTEVTSTGLPPSQERVQSIADALAASSRREQLALAVGGSTPDASSRRISMTSAARGEADIAVNRIGTAGRRSAARRTRSAARRDGTA